MAKRISEMEEPLPLDLQLDLLVDEELSEEQRRTLLRSLDRTPEKWRELSLRFLERQVERKTVCDLIAGGKLLPAEAPAAPAARYRFPRMFATRSGAISAVAAGLLIAVSSAAVTMVVLRSPASSGMNNGLNNGTGSGTGKLVATGQDARTLKDAEVFDASLPGSAFGLQQPVPVQVPVLQRAGESGAELFPASSGNRGRRAVVIQPDGSGNAVVIPVNTLKVY